MPRVLPDTTNVLTTGAGLAGNGLTDRSLLQHHMRIGATDPERGHPGPPRTPHRRPLMALAAMVNRDAPAPACGVKPLEVQVLRNMAVLHDSAPS